MKNFKTVIIFSSFGFILSLIFGIFSNSKFVKIIGTALIFALVFAILGFLISFVFSKFLNEDNLDYVNAETNSTPSANTNVGNNVDIVIEDQELESSESPNKYDVGQTVSMLNDSDVQNKERQSLSTYEQEAQNTGFIPVRNLETLKNFSASESVKPDEVSAKEKLNESSDELDELPNFSGFSNSGGSSSEQPFSDVRTSDISYSDTSVGSAFYRKNEVDSDKFQNTELIAKAISSALSSEEE